MTDLHYGADEALLKRLDKPRRDLLRDVMSYNDSMTISQVIKFFERQGVEFTKPMIQHYVRAGVLPPPEDKRRYTRFHLLLLAVIEQLKGVYALDEMSAVFSEFSPSDRLIGLFQDVMEFAAASWRETLDGVMDKAAETAGELGADDQDTRRLFEAFMILGIMSQSAAAKQAAGMMIGGLSE